MYSLTIDFNNRSTKKPAFYQSNDPAQNELTLTVSNNTGSPVTFPAGSSQLRIGFGSLLSTKEANAITISDAGWSVSPDNASRGAAVALSPKSDVQLGVNASFSLNVTLPSVSKQPASGNLTILWSGVTGTTDDEIVLRFFILKPPSGKPVLPLNAGWLSSMPAVVYVSADSNNLLANSLGLFLSNASGSPLADLNATGTNPRFLISFPTIARPDPNDPFPNPGMNALTYDDLAKDIGMRAIGDGNNNWSLTPAYGTSNESLVWELKPLTPGILGGGQSVEVIVDRIRTALPPFTTVMHIQYVDIPGYDDGIITLHLQKSSPEPGIMSFYSEATNIELGDSATLNWSTFAVRSLELSYSIDDQTIVKSSDNGDILLDETGYKLPLNQSTTFTLTAYDMMGQCVQKQLIITVHQLAISMGIQPLVLAQGSTAKLSWKVSGSDQDTCILDPGGIMLPLSGTDYRLTVMETTTYAITAFNSKRNPACLSNETTVSVPPVSIVSFTSDSTKFEGLPIRLSWNVEYASSVEFDPIELMIPPRETPLRPVDRCEVLPQRSTTYTLTANGFNGPVQAKVEVQVIPVEIVCFKVEPSDAVTDKPYKLIWETRGADRVKLDGNLCSESGSILIEPMAGMTIRTHLLICDGFPPMEAHIIVKNR
ncbi:hypothetical protein [Paenibacillus kobensis]|uniref:hypothetical protein n=1 Tax=Paenibacillus kobensis TaxID=59841 RepID=UPI000FDCB449|nr:hypothetical protein [Paenibacillus kobensis]